MSLSLLGVSFAMIFPALKHKLDSFSYRITLYEKQKKYIAIINDIAKKWTNHNDLTDEDLKEMREQLCGTNLMDCYFLFTEKTYAEILKIRESLECYRSFRGDINNEQLKKALDILNKIPDRAWFEKVFKKSRMSDY